MTHLPRPYTTQQNGRAERILRTINDSLRTMLLHAAAPPTLWPDALATVTYLLNRRPCPVRSNITRHELLLSLPPAYEHLRVFESVCYPNTDATASHKLAPRSSPCIFTGYPAGYEGYRCYKLDTRRVITSRHVPFDENVFPSMGRSRLQPTAGDGL